MEVGQGNADMDTTGVRSEDAEPDTNARIGVPARSYTDYVDDLDS